MEANHYNSALHAVVANFNGFLKHEEFTSICMGTLEVAKQHRTSKILVDTTQLKVMLIENQQWVDQVWFKEAKQVGIEYMAFLIPNDFFGKVGMEASNKTAIEEGKIQIRYFNRQVAAEKWLQSL